MSDYDPFLPLLARIAKSREITLHTRGIWHIPLHELENEGFFGLNEAMSTFDPAKNTQFDYYAYKKINYSISLFLRNLDHVPKETRKSLKDVARCEEKLMQLLGRLPCEEEVAEEMEWSVDKLRKLRQAAERGKTVSANKNNDEGGSMLDVLRAEVELPEKKLDDAYLAKATNDCMIRWLNSDETLVLLLRTLRGFVARQVVELMKDKEVDINRVNYLFTLAKNKMAKCLRSKGIPCADL